MTVAFGGDGAVKSALLDRLRRHAADATLLFGPTSWDGRAGTPIGVSTRGGDSADYAAQFGYPLALAGLLDPMTAYAGPDRAVDVALAWVERVPVGTDLSPVAERIVDHLLDAMDADGVGAPYRATLRRYYAAERSDTPPARRDWADLRARIERAVQDERPASDARTALVACAAACWPLATSGSVLPTLFALWVGDANRRPDPEFGEALRVRAHAVLETIYRETQPLRDAGAAVDIPARFRDREPTLAAAFEAQLARSNARHRDRAQSVPDVVLAHLAAAA